MNSFQMATTLDEWAVLYATGRVFTCMSIGIEKGRPLFEFGGIDADDPRTWRLTGTATKDYQRMRLTGWPRLVDNPDAMVVLDTVASGDLSVLDWDDDADFDPDQEGPHEYPPPGVPPPEYERAWTLATDPIEHAVIYDDGGVVTVWAHQVETTPTHYRFHVTLDDGADVIMGTATHPGAICQLTGSPTLADDPTTASILDAAYHGNLEPARRYHGA